MSKNFLVILFLFSILVSYGQKSSLIKNVNFRAKELKHDLNQDGDSLLLESKQTIYQVEIYNSFYEKKMSINRYKTKVAINDLPQGKYITEVVLSDRRIIMTLIRHEAVGETMMLSDAPLKSISITSIETDNIPQDMASYAEPIKIAESTQQPNESEAEDLNFKNEEQLADIKNEETDIKINTTQTDNNIRGYNYSPSALLNTRLKKPSERSNKKYWIEIEINTGNSSYKTKKIVSGDLIADLISQNKAEIKTARGRNNKLTIWEVYDTSKFMKEQLLNRNYASSSESSQYFNPVPYYQTRKSKTSR
ncbi:hypothetical protein [Winogradskyella vincentii]|uniref:Uncharacterized protein n=1 Tax=Winogradskyella vincentii TaxID=2877122 RepID=A0ABS7Y2Z5_9FLAO|nr:hypothetical protein [Winogradskyella vincentii]MCA0154315.1 hypothetical protein [Winogradskyella vincentii]